MYYFYNNKKKKNLARNFPGKKFHQNSQMASLNLTGLLDSLLQELVGSKPNTILSLAM